MKNTDCTFRATLRIDLVDWADEHRFAQYERVKIGHEKRWYKVSFGVCPFCHHIKLTQIYLAQHLG